MTPRIRKAIRLRSEKRAQQYRAELLEMKMRPQEELTIEDRERLRIIPQNIRFHEEIIKAHSD